MVLDGLDPSVYDMLKEAILAAECSNGSDNKVAAETTPSCPSASATTWWPPPSQGLMSHLNGHHQSSYYDRGWKPNCTLAASLSAWSWSDGAWVAGSVSRAEMRTTVLHGGAPGVPRRQSPKRAQALWSSAHGVTSASNIARGQCRTCHETRLERATGWNAHGSLSLRTSRWRAGEGATGGSHERECCILWECVCLGPMDGGNH